MRNFLWGLDFLTAELDTSHPAAAEAIRELERRRITSPMIQTGYCVGLSCCAYEAAAASERLVYRPDRGVQIYELDSYYGHPIVLDESENDPRWQVLLPHLHQLFQAEETICLLEEEQAEGIIEFIYPQTVVTDPYRYLIQVARSMEGWLLNTRGHTSVRRRRATMRQTSA